MKRETGRKNERRINVKCKIWRNERLKSETVTQIVAFWLTTLCNVVTNVSEAFVASIFRI